MADLLAACLHLKILVTSRAILRLQREYEFVVPPLWTVQLFAAAAAARTAHGYNSSLGSEPSAQDRILAEARTQLGERTYDAAWAAGQTMTPQQALSAAARIPMDRDVQALLQTQPAPARSAPLTKRERERERCSVSSHRD